MNSTARDFTLLAASVELPVTLSAGTWRARIPRGAGGAV
jgi:hypothetical protein